MSAEERQPAPLTRRAVFIAAAAIGVPLPAVAAIDPRWKTLIREVSALHENGLAAALHAYAHRDVIEPDGICGVQLRGQDEDRLPALVFEGRDPGVLYTARPDGLWVGRPVPRGAGSRVL